VAGDQSTGVDPKKRTVAARERDPQQRAAWWTDISRTDARQLIFVDETSTNTAMLTRYARSPRGTRAHASAPRNYGPNVTLAASLSMAGAGPAMVVQDALTSEGFVAYLEQALVPSLQPGQIVVLDNLSVHRHTRVRQVIEAAGCELRFLPSYSPDFAPIEQGFAKLKGSIRRAQARTYDALVAAIGAGLDEITAQDARGCFRGCGYTAP
jgi:transposase